MTDIKQTTRQLLERIDLTLLNIELDQLTAEQLDSQLSRIAERLELISFDEVSLNAIESLTEAVNNLTGAINEVNTIKVHSDGEDGVKIWPRGEVKIINPLITKMPSKQRRPREPTTDEFFGDKKGGATDE